MTPLTSLVVVKPNSTSAVDAEAVQPGNRRPGTHKSTWYKHGNTKKYITINLNNCQMKNIF